ncbi:MAG: hypothetical protein VKJ02_03510 [Snowella sp.]|nr:hypothetical protein [Snowella sp.]
MPYRRDGTSLGFREKLLDLCRRAVEAKLLYACGESTPYPSFDPSKSNDTTTVFKPAAPKPWFAKVKPMEDEQYFTADELHQYLTNLLKSQGL